tara:strand:+ start:436 stop:1050 length:615 start_codon:yes stop_codon:yes gene_type:complete
MCDPVTLTAVSTAVGNLGMQQGAAFFASAAGSSLSVGIGQAMSVATAVAKSPITTIGMSLLGGRHQARAYDYEAQRAEYQAKAYKREAEMRDLEALQKQNNLKKKYLTDRGSNKAILASRGISVASASYKALMEENYDNFMATSNNMRMVDMDQIIKSKESAYISGVESKVQRNAQKETGIVSLIKGVQSAGKIYGESKSLFST